ncbi:MAG: HD domain-containing protein [Steroidobacteraceae bacterium]
MQIHFSLNNTLAFMAELDKLKLVERRAYVQDGSRHENSAEHSWFLAMTLLTLASELQLPIDLHKALKMALIHDVCEIDAGDIGIYDPRRGDNAAEELACINRLSQLPLSFTDELATLWHEFEAQQTPESRWVKVLDRFTPFVTNLLTEGKTWRELNITRSQVIAVNKTVHDHAPEIYAWMLPKIDEAVTKGWLRNE